MTRPLAPLDMVTLFVDGFGVQIPRSKIEGSPVSDGDSVSQESLDLIARGRACPSCAGAFPYHHIRKRRAGQGAGLPVGDCPKCGATHTLKAFKV